MAPLAAKSCRQRQPITTTLKTICRSYPPSTCLRELLQNADDAGATELDYVLDTNTYPAKPLIHPLLAEDHGPALLARNNSLFKEQDFDSLSRVGDSSKLADLEKTGKFGQGFNSVYHWTDGPWVYSGPWLVFLDPHQHWSAGNHAGGPMYNVVENKDHPEIQNHLKTFSAFEFQRGKELDQTIIRIPLRTANQAATSEIIPREAKIDDVRETLERFAKDMQQGGLLFLRNIAKIVVRVNSTIIASAEILPGDRDQMIVRRSLHSDFIYLYKVTQQEAQAKPISKSCEITIEFSHKSESWTDTYLVQHLLLPSSGDQKLDEWAREWKLFPRTAIAAPLRLSKNTFEGKLFSTLSLHIKTHQPVHIDGLFAIAPDRARLSDDDQAIKWNNFIFRHGVAKAWANLLEHRSFKSPGEENFGLWPRADLTFKSEDPWTGLVGHVLDLALRENMSIWNATNASCIPFDRGLFIVEGSDTLTYCASWKAIKLPGVILDQPMFCALSEMARQRPLAMKLLTSSEVRKFLQRNRQIPQQCAAELLEYSLLDIINHRIDDGALISIWPELYSIPIWPVLNKGLQAVTKTRPLLLARDDKEMNLFSASRPEDTLDSKRATSQVRVFLHSHAAGMAVLARFRNLNDLPVDWPYLFKPQHVKTTAKSISRKGMKDALLCDIWDWIYQRSVGLLEKVPHPVGDLWLLPLQNSQIRKLACSEADTPALVLESTDFMRKALSKLPRQHTGNAPIVDGDAISPSTIKLLKQFDPQKINWRLTSQDSLIPFVDWLVDMKTLLQEFPDREKHELVAHLANLMRREEHRTIALSVTEKIPQLPLFSKKISSPPHKQWKIVRVPIETHSQAMEMPLGLPPLPTINGLSLYDLSDLDECFVFKRLGLLQNSSAELLLDKYLLPWVVNDTSNLLDAPRIALIDWVFQKSQDSRNQSWKRLISTRPTVPLPLCNGVRKYARLGDLVDPESPYAELYFDDEGVFPAKDFFEKHRHAARACGIRSGIDFPGLELGRAKVYAQRPVDEVLLRKVRRLVSIEVEGKLPTSQVNEIRQLEWVPGTTHQSNTNTLFAPSKCRSWDERHLIDVTWGATRLQPLPGWKTLLGWDKRVPQEVLFRQLDRCTKLPDHDIVDALLSYFTLDETRALSQKHCILGSHGSYMLPRDVFYPSRALATTTLAPYLDRVDTQFAAKHVNHLSILRVDSEPSLKDLQRLQASLQADRASSLNEVDLVMSINSLEVATRLGYDNSTLQVPDTTAVLRSLTDIVHGDRITTGKMADFYYVHPRVSNHLTERLHIEECHERANRLDIEYEDEDEDEFTPGEELTDIISDTLARYPVATTFNEFLANADDAGAEIICWTIETRVDSPAAAQCTLSQDLKAYEGPALIVYNDATFADADFVGMRKIGQGGKANDADSTGMFGRGIMTMYHFTDVPMLLSGGYLLILDPQQRCLPRKQKSMKRKVGVKISLREAQQRAKDQLALFNGLHGFQMDMDFFEGTLFRLPLRTSYTQTKLKESTELLDAEKLISLLDDYMRVARSSLLYLRSIENITVGLRHKESPEWSVSISRPEGLEGKVFYNAIVSTSRGAEKPQYDLWLIGVQDIDASPKDIPKVGKGLQKTSECGVAACLQYNRAERPSFDGKYIRTSSKAAARTELEQNLFCKLPIQSACGLPVSCHASFAITGDRKTLASGNEDSQARWNQWLAKEQIPEFYIAFLVNAAPRYGPDTLYFWPKRHSGATSSLSEVIAESFWDKLADENRRDDKLYPVSQVVALTDKSKSSLKQPVGRARRVLHQVTNANKAHFDFLSSSDSLMLQPLLQKLGFSVVRPLYHVQKEFKDLVQCLQLSAIGPESLCKVMKDSSHIKTLGQYLGTLELEDQRVGLVSLFVRVLTPDLSDKKPEALNLLQDCGVVPRPQLALPFGALDFRSHANTIYHLQVNTEERKLFHYAADDFVHMDLFRSSLKSPDIPTRALRDPINEWILAGANIRPLGLEDIHDLLSRHDSPTNARLAPEQYETWLNDFWKYFNRKFASTASCSLQLDVPNLKAREILDKANICDQPLYKIHGKVPQRCITPKAFADGAFIICPDNEQQRQLCAQIPGLKYIDARYTPSILASTESNLRESESFARFVRALLRIHGGNLAQIKQSLSTVLTPEARTLLRALLLSYLADFDSSNNVPALDALRNLPVWPCVAPPVGNVSLGFLTAAEASFCKHQAMFVSWIKSLSKFVTPHIVQEASTVLPKLKIQPFSVAAFWARIAADLPVQLSSTLLIEQYRGLVEILASNNTKTAMRIALDGNGALVNPGQLYDYEDDVFRRAFQDERTYRFLHPSLRDLRGFFIHNNLRTRSREGALTHHDFLECCRAVDRRWKPNTPDGSFISAAEAVTSHLEYERREFSQWPGATWDQLSTLRIFKVRRTVTNQPYYRHPGMQALTQQDSYCALQDVARPSDIRHCWSVVKLVDNRLASQIYDRMPNRGAPALEHVYQHLQNLVGLHIAINPADVPEYLKDIQACYAYLQNSSRASFLPNIISAKIWFNLDSATTETIPQAALAPALQPASVLYLEAPCDTTSIIRTKKFLAPYEVLLELLGCGRFEQPPPPAPRADKSTKPFALGPGMDALRQQNVLVDVYIEAEGRRIPAHKVVLAASSDYCKAQFSGSWALQTQNPTVLHFDCGLGKVLTFQRMLDFAYGIKITRPKLKDPEDADEIADRLDELLDLLVGANGWQMLRLRDMIEDFLTEPANAMIYRRADNVRHIKELAEQAHAARLIKDCEDYIQKNKAGIERMDRS